MLMRRLLLCLLLLLTACGSDPPSSLVPAPSEPAPAPASDPRSLAGRWAVSGAGVLPGTTLTLNDSSSIDSSLVLDMPCGQVGGAWAVAGEQSLLVGDVSAGAQPCFGKSGIQGADWLRLVTGFRLSAEGPELLSSQQQVVATLRRTGPVPSTTPAEGLGMEFAVPAALPSGSLPPTSDQLQGRWLPVLPPPSAAFAEFTADRRWHGSDGCNGSGGQYVLGAQGRLLATSGPTTLIGCAGSGLPHWVAQASRVGVVGDELVFYDAKAKELGRAKPAG